MQSVHHTKKNNKTPSKTLLKAVTASSPCPVCNGGHKCSVGDDGLIVCGRTQGPVAGFRCLGPAEGDPQFTLYRPKGKTPLTSPATNNNKATNEPVVDWEDKATHYARLLTPRAAEELAENLGLPEGVVEQFGIGWDPKLECWLFPERDAAGDTVGLCRRYRDSRKRFLAGGSRGLSFITPFSKSELSPIFLPEGATDTLALTAMGLIAVGARSATAGVEQLAALLEDVPAKRPIIVLGENDRKPDGRWPGKEGAVATATALAQRLNRSIQFAFPPDGAKDVRAWLHAQKPDMDDGDAMMGIGSMFRGLAVVAARDLFFGNNLWPSTPSLCQRSLPIVCQVGCGLCRSSGRKQPRPQETWRA